MGGNKVIARNTVILYLKLCVVSVVGLLTSRYIIQALGVSDFGLYSVVGSIVFMMAFLNNIMITTTYRFIAFELGQVKQDVNSVFNVSLIIHISLALLVLILSEVIGVYYINNYIKVEPDRLSDALFVFRLSIFSAVVSILSVPYQGLIIAKEKFLVASVIEIIRSILGLAVVLLILFYSGDRLRLYAILISIVSILPSVLFYIYSKKFFGLETAWKFQKGKRKYKEMVQFSGWVMFGASAAAAELQISVIMVNLFFGTVINASFGIANQVNNLVKMFGQSVNQSFIPQITKSVSAGDSKRSFDLVVFSSKYSFFLILVPAVPILLETDYLLKLWLEVVPPYTSVLIQLFILTAMIRTMSAGVPALFQASGTIKHYQIVASCLVLAGLPLSYFLFKMGFPPYTLSIVFLTVAVLDLFIVQILLKIVLNFDILNFCKRVYFKNVLVILCILPLFALPHLLPSNFWRFFILSLGSMLVILIAVYYFGMDKIEREFAKMYVAKFFKVVGLPN